MKHIISLFTFVIFSFTATAQSHTYKSNCRYFKCPPGMHCATQDGAGQCPACKSDDDDEVKARDDEAKRQMEEKAAIEKVRQQKLAAELKKKVEEDKKTDEQSLSILKTTASSNNQNTQQNTILPPLNTKPSGCIVFNENGYVGIKKGETVIFKSNEFYYASAINAENRYFVFSKGYIRPEEPLSKKNSTCIYDERGKVKGITGFNSFYTVRYNERENAIYATILTGDKILNLKPYGMESSIGDKADGHFKRSGYYTEEFIKLNMEYDAANSSEWSGHGYDFEKLIVLKMDKNLTVLQRFTGYKGDRVIW